MEGSDERTEELEATLAIFPELVVDAKNSFAATIDIPVKPEKPLKIYFQSSVQTAPSDIPTPPDSNSATSIEKNISSKPPDLLTPAISIDTHSLTHLPPVRIAIQLPDGYPYDVPPQISVTSESSWLPESTVTRLQNQAQELWEEYGRSQMVFSYLDFLQQEAEKAFELNSTSDNKFSLSSDLKLSLLAYDLKRKREEFEGGTYDCGVCLEPKKGKVCHQLLLCNHVFCVQCLQDFYNDCITSGDVDSVKCLDPSCSKEFSQIVTASGRKKTRDLTLNPSELLQIPIEQEKVQRYVHLKRKKKLESDKNTVYCPRTWCGGVAKSPNHPKPNDPLHDVDEAESDVEEAAANAMKNKPTNIEDNRLNVCEDCNYAFCSLCGKGWHGSYLACKPRSTKELNAEEQASQDYLAKYSTPCPTCNAPAQKSMGCNHMICFKCKTHFCYLCSAYLLPDNPYIHFNTIKSPCYMRLWELEGGDGADVGIGYAGGNAFRHDAQPWEIDPDLLDSDSDEESEDELSDEDFAEFGGEDPIDWDDGSDDDDVAPDQRRADRPHIEIVVGGQNRRIDLPQRQAVPAAAPPAHNAARGRNRGRGGRQANARGGRGQGRGGGPRPVPHQARLAVPVVPEVRRAVPVIHQQQQQQQNRAAVQALNEIVERQQEEVAGPVVNAAPGQGNNIDEALQRFLQLAVEDREDEWNSDEDDYPAAVRHNVPGQQRVRNRRR